MKRIFIISICLCAILIACSSIPPLSKNKAEDFTTTGFLDDNHFQVVITASPEKKTNGLVNSRENAIVKARNNLQKEVITALRDKYIFLQKIYLSENEQILLNKKLYHLISYGKTYAEFFDKRKNAYIIYRIKKMDLKDMLTSIKVKKK